jgi:hypothetical protein
MTIKKPFQTERLEGLSFIFDTYWLFLASLKNRPLKVSIGAEAFFLKQKRPPSHAFRAKRETVRNSELTFI